MEKVFGETLNKCVINKKPEESKEESAATEENQADFSPYETVKSDEITLTTHILVLFTAEYCPPCDAFMQPFKDFVAEANKDSSNPKFTVVVVNCDKKEDQYQ